MILIALAVLAYLVVGVVTARVYRAQVLSEGPCTAGDRVAQATLVLAWPVPLVVGVASLLIAPLVGMIGEETTR